MDQSESSNIQYSSHIDQMLDDMQIFDSECWEYVEEVSVVSCFDQQQTMDSNNNVTDNSNSRWNTQIKNSCLYTLSSKCKPNKLYKISQIIDKEHERILYLASVGLVSG